MGKLVCYVNKGMGYFCLTLYSINALIYWPFTSKQYIDCSNAYGISLLAEVWNTAFLLEFSFDTYFVTKEKSS